MKLINNEHGYPVKTGDTLLDFRGAVHVLQGGNPPHKPSSTGRIYTNRGQFFPSVCGLKWINEELEEVKS